MICILAKPRLDDFRGISLGSSKFAASVASQSSGGLRSHGVARASVHPCIRPSMHSCIHAFVHSCIRAFDQLSTHQLIHRFKPSISTHPTAHQSSVHRTERCVRESASAGVLLSRNAYLIPQAPKRGKKAGRQEGKKARRQEDEANWASLNTHGLQLHERVFNLVSSRRNQRTAHKDQASPRA